MKSRLKKEIYVLGVSSNDKFLSDEYIERLSNVIKNSTYFSVRDKNSYDTINKYCKGINSKSIKIVSDIVFANKNLRLNNFLYIMLMSQISKYINVCFWCKFV